MCAETEAQRTGADSVDSVHLALACLSQGDSDVDRLLSHHAVSPEVVAGMLRVDSAVDSGRGKLPMSDVVKRELVAAMRLAMDADRTMVTSAHLLEAILLVDPDGELCSALGLAGANPEQWRKDLGSGVSGESLASGQNPVKPA